MEGFDFSMLNGVGLSALTIVVTLAILRFVPGASSWIFKNADDKREHTQQSSLLLQQHQQKMERWRAERDYRREMLLLTALIKMSGGSEIELDTEEIMSSLLEVEDELPKPKPPSIA